MERGLSDERIGLGYTNPVGIGGVLDVCMYLFIADITYPDSFV